MPTVLYLTKNIKTHRETYNSAKLKTILLTLKKKDNEKHVLEGMLLFFKL
jgi:hypothetical protein